MSEKSAAVNAETLKTITEVEGVRVWVDRNVARRCVMIQTELKQDRFNTIFEVDDLEIEMRETADTVQFIGQCIRERARDMRRYAILDLLERDVGLNDEDKRGTIVAAIVGNNDVSVCERLALDLMAHVERLGK